jgi:hypothetical protein
MEIVEDHQNKELIDDNCCPETAGCQAKNGRETQAVSVL